MAEMRPLVEAAFSKWKPGSVGKLLTPISAGPATPAVYLIDKPGTPQTVIHAAPVAPPRKQGDAIARDAMNTVLGGSFTSRLNMKLREEKGWGYGARSSSGGGRGSQVFTASASGQADRTAESMAEIATLLGGIASTRPVDAAEVAAARDEMSLGLTDAWATSGGIANYLMDQQVHGLPPDYYATYPGRVAAVAVNAVNREAVALFSNRPITWVVVGDRSKIEGSIRSLRLGGVRVIDPEGNPVPGGSSSDGG